jgi:hypothetical protein
MHMFFVVLGFFLGFLLGLWFKALTLRNQKKTVTPQHYEVGVVVLEKAEEYVENSDLTLQNKRSILTFIALCRRLLELQTKGKECKHK